ncbi:MAG: hypothetical protein ACI96N_001105, partial [Arenicella sp.]
HYRVLDKLMLSTSRCDSCIRGFLWLAICGIEEI